VVIRPGGSAGSFGDACRRCPFAGSRLLALYGASAGAFEALRSKSVEMKVGRTLLRAPRLVLRSWLSSRNACGREGRTTCCRLPFGIALHGGRRRDAHRLTESRSRSVFSSVSYRGEQRQRWSLLSFQGNDPCWLRRVLHRLACPVSRGAVRRFAGRRVVSNFEPQSDPSPTGFVIPASPLSTKALGSGE